MVHSQIVFNYQVEIVDIITSPGHNYFGNKSVTPREHPTVLHKRIEAVAGKGLVGDRFFNIRPNHRSQVTFFAYEVWQNIKEQLGVEAHYTVFRRNIITRGIDLKALIGADFVLSGIEFRGTRHCAPCKWMNRVFHPEALRTMRGRGGLQTQVLSTGILTKGAATLQSPVEIDSSQIIVPIKKLRLP